MVDIPWSDVFPFFPLQAETDRWLDKDEGSSFAYVAAVYHGIGAGLFYSTTGASFNLSKAKCDLKQ